MTPTDLTLQTLVIRVINVATEQNVIKDSILDKIIKDIKKMMIANENFYTNVMKYLTINKINDVLTECFVDDVTNYGRMIAVLTLLYVYARKNKDNYRCLNMLKNIFTNVLLKEMAPVINKCGGFNNFINPCNHYFCVALYLAISGYLVTRYIYFGK